jgi:hypothetical protein
MKKVLLLSFILLFINLSYACEDCRWMNFEQIVNISDLIIIGQKVGEGPSTALLRGDGGPDWIKVEVIEVFKGSPKSSVIKVNSWDQMCPYGVIIEDSNRHVMLLREWTDLNDKFQYNSAGCGIDSYPIIDEQIDFSGELVSIDEFVSRLGPGASRHILENKPEPAAYFILPALAILIIIIILFNRKK